ncbi:MAG: aspartyl protease family protein [Prevotellaceae bacterium]|nr:aspartyl protease family protein [Prevotellaceae bacterium]
MTPVKCGIADEFIFDSGANISTITDSCAKKMGLTIYESDISVGTTTDAKLKSRLAAADSFYVGDILFENVVFLVVPAEQMSFPQVNYEIHGVIGFPVLYQMEEIRIRKDGRVVVPKTSENRNLNNMFLSGLKPAVQLTSHNDTLIFLFDTGANTSELSKKYYENHRTEVEQNGALQTRSRGGGGGIVEAEEYELKDFPYTIGAKSSVLPKISVVVQDYDFVKHFDGNLGQDVITQFNEMILNFKHMYIDFE